MLQSVKCGNNNGYLLLLRQLANSGPSSRALVSVKVMAASYCCTL